MREESRSAHTCRPPRGARTLVGVLLVLLAVPLGISAHTTSRERFGHFVNGGHMVTLSNEETLECYTDLYEAGWTGLGPMRDNLQTLMRSQQRRTRLLWSGSALAAAIGLALVVSSCSWRRRHSGATRDARPRWESST